MSAVPWRWRVGRELRWWVNTHGRHQFIDRSRQRPRLAIILAGYYPDLWPATVERIAAFAPADLDICVVGAGPRAGAAMDLAARHGWSCVRTSDAQPSLAMNLAVQHHPATTLIHKLDEDIVIPEGYFDRLERGLATAATGPISVEVIAPALNVNPFSYRLVLESLGALVDYEQRFGAANYGLFSCPAYHSAAAAEWIWEQCLPFAKADHQLAANNIDHASALIPVPMRFCIGAILLRRSWWHEIGGFRRKVFGAALGVDEEHLCFATQNRGKGIAVQRTILAGHLGFAPQRPGLQAVMPSIMSRIHG